MNQLVEFDLPFLIQGKVKGTLSLGDAGLLGSELHFVRFDLYPQVSPSHMQRHYGWWDIPLKEITEKRTPIWVDLAARLLNLPQQGKTFPLAWQGLQDEEGYCHLHVSVWEASADPPRMLTVKSQRLVMATRGLDLPLKQVCLPVTDRCNLHCTMCPRQSTGDIVDMDIPDEALGPGINAGPHFVSAMLQGLGEPLLYPKLASLIPRVKARMAPGGEVGFTSNATLLDAGMAARLLETGLDFLYFSVDGASKQVYESIRVGASFERVTENIRRCVQYSRAAGRTRPRFMMNFVMLEQNCHEIPAYVSLAARLGVEHVTFSYCTDTAVIGRFKSLGAARLRDLFSQAREEGEKLQVQVNTPALQKNPQEICFFMERATVIMPGLVYPCHAMAPGQCLSPSNLFYGDVRRTPVVEIWNNPAYQQVRRRILTGNFPEECQNCDLKSYWVA